MSTRGVAAGATTSWEGARTSTSDGEEDGAQTPTASDLWQAALRGAHAIDTKTNAARAQDVAFNELSGLLFG